MRYELVREDTAFQLSETVTQRLKEGWEALRQSDHGPNKHRSICNVCAGDDAGTRTAIVVSPRYTYPDL